MGPVSAAFEAVRGVKDAAERAVVRVMVGSAAGHERARSLFLRSAYAANRFNHPRVLPVLGDGLLESGAAYVVRAWADAEPLTNVVQARGKLSEREVLRIAEQLLDALEMAHSHGIVHGAVTPDNVLITERGSMRLADFAAPPGLPGSRMASELDLLASRRSGPFAAPERCAMPPLPPSEAGDIFAVGAVMFYALTGEAPRGTAEGPALAQTAARSLRDVLPEVGEELAQVVDFALRFDPIHRYESAYAMLGDVRRVLAGRKPKLREAVGPSPSSTFDMPGRAGPSSGSILSVGRRSASPVRRAGGADRVRSSRDEWRGNVALILAIALLVGVATFVVVRERVEEGRHEPGASPTEPGERSER
jgi:serine/threonine protein kinase